MKISQKKRKEKVFITSSFEKKCVQYKSLIWKDFLKIVGPNRHTKNSMFILYLINGAFKWRYAEITCLSGVFCYWYSYLLQKKNVLLGPLKSAKYYLQNPQILNSFRRLHCLEFEMKNGRADPSYFVFASFYGKNDVKMVIYCVKMDI